MDVDGYHADAIESPEKTAVQARNGDGTTSDRPWRVSSRPIALLHRGPGLVDDGRAPANRHAAWRGDARQAAAPQPSGQFRIAMPSL